MTTKTVAQAPVLPVAGSPKHPPKEPRPFDPDSPMASPPVQGRIGELRVIYDSGEWSTGVSRTTVRLFIYASIHVVRARKRRRACAVALIAKHLEKQTKRGIGM